MDCKLQQPRFHSRALPVWGTADGRPFGGRIVQSAARQLN